MRIKESLQLDTVIRDRAHSLFLENDHDALGKKSRVLMALIECREKMDDIMRGSDPIVEHSTNVGDIHVNVTGKGRGNNDSNAPYRPFDNGDTGRQLARELKKELRGA